MSSHQKAEPSRFRFPLAVCMLLWAGSLAGCGSGDPFAYVPASGKVTYDDGSKIPAAQIKLLFIAENPPVVDSKTFAPPGKVDVSGAEGTFDVVTSHHFGDGLLPGKHKVIVMAFDDKRQPIPGLIPPEYGALKTTPVEVDTATQPLEIKVKKPAGVKAPPRKP